MREIKFRAWDKKHSIMLQGIELTKLLSYLIFQNCPNSEAYDLMKDHFNEIEWLEYTGLKDKNGKEIYEGDIVSVGENGLNDKTNYQVKHYGDEGYPAFDLEGWDGETNALSEISQGTEWEMEVIGNIYENPNLLS